MMVLSAYELQPVGSRLRGNDGVAGVGDYSRCGSKQKLAAG